MSLGIVVLDELSNDESKVRLAEGDDAVETLASNGSNEGGRPSVATLESEQSAQLSTRTTALSQLHSHNCTLAHPGPPRTCKN
jgi:hypothetical protein